MRQIVKIVFMTMGISLSVKTFGFIVFDPTNYAKNLITAANSVRTVENQVTQIRNELQALQFETKNTNTVLNYQWQNITQLTQRLDQSTQQEQALSYSMGDLDSQFRQRYPNYTNTPGSVNYTDAYHRWNDTTLDTLRHSLSAIGMSASDFQNEETLLSQLSAQGRTATGRMQVLQVSTEIAAENVNQLQELKRIMMTQTNAQNSYLAYQVSKDSYDEQSLEAINSHMDSDFPEYRNNDNFGLIPLKNN